MIIGYPDKVLQIKGWKTLVHPSDWVMILRVDFKKDSSLAGTEADLFSSSSLSAAVRTGRALESST